MCLAWVSDLGVMYGYNVVHVGRATCMHISYYFVTYSPAEDGRRIVVPGLPRVADTPGA